MEHSISIIVPAWNEEPYLLKTSKFLKRLSLPFKYSEIIFVAGGNDDTFKICNKFELNNFDNVITIKQEPGDYKSGALIKGLKQAKGDYIILIDADVFVSPNLVIEISKLMLKFDSVCCNFIPMINKGFWYDYYNIIKLIWAQNPKNLNSLIGGATISLNRDVIDEIGIERFFSQNTTAGVDYYMSLMLKKYNKSIGFVKTARVIMPRPNNIKDFIKDWKRWLTAFVSLHKGDKKFLFSNLFLDFLHCLFPPLIFLSNFKKLMKISKGEYLKVKIHFILFIIEFIKKFLSINAILRNFSKSQKSLGHFKGVDRYF
ncbi:MAG: glycosyltransferase family 2 protein [Candidatus Lokiarchaeia archaeon]